MARSQTEITIYEKYHLDYIIHDYWLNDSFKDQTPSKAIDIQITITAGISTKGIKSGVVIAQH